MTAPKETLYRETLSHIENLIAGETDPIAIMATVVCELHHAFDYFDWTGFYRLVEPDCLKIGPYQGVHGCLRIHLDRGVCGAAARTRQTQRVDDVRTFPGYIACSASTLSEIVVPVLDSRGRLLAVLDVDSGRLAAFDDIDQYYLETLCQRIGEIAE